MTTFPNGPGYVCIDATALIQFEELNQLFYFEKWFGDPVFTPHAVEWELGKNAARKIDNKAILTAPWITKVVVDDPTDVQKVVQLRRRWSSALDKDWGEAEVIVLCQRFGWTAIMEDRTGREACIQAGIPVVYWTSMIIAAAAHGLITMKDAWNLHKSLSLTSSPGIISAHEVHKPIFEKSIAVVAQLAKKYEYGWPQTLGSGKVDGLVERVRQLAS